MLKHPVNKVRYQNLEKNKQHSLLSNAGGVSAGGAETTPTRGKAAVSLNGLPLKSNTRYSDGGGAVLGGSIASSSHDLAPPKKILITKMVKNCLTV